MKDLIDTLHAGDYTLVVRSADGALHCFSRRGVKDLLTLVTQSPQVLCGSHVADKAVGKAAAACMAVGGVVRVHADVMSEPALALLQSRGIRAQYGQLVDHIINRAGDDWCPMERLSRDIDDPNEIITRIQNSFQSR